MTDVIQVPSTATSAQAHRPHDGASESDQPSIHTHFVYVVHTRIDDTLAAVRAMRDFANGLNVPIAVVHLRTVPYSLPFDAPTGISPIEADEFASRLRAEELNPHLEVYLGRDEHQTMKVAFKSPSLVVVAGRRGWWPNDANRLRRMLEAENHFVVFVDTSAKHSGTDRCRDRGVASVAAEPSGENFRA